MSDDLRTKDFLARYTSCQRQLYVYVRCHVPNAQDADDVLQNISGVLWEKFGQFRPDENFASWACGVARLEVLKFRQQNKRAKTVSLKEDLADRVLDDILQASTDANILYEAMRDCLEKVSAWGRWILKLRYESGKSVVDIAKEVGCTEAAVYKTLQRIHDALYDCVEVELARTRSSSL
jgi:RNA polymerase sigma-70 factor (ECF subfamily)